MLGESKSCLQGPTGSVWVWARRVQSPVAYLVAEPEKCFKDCYHYFTPSECSCHLRDGVSLRQGNDIYDGFMSITSPVSHLVEADLFFRYGVSGAITSSCLPRAVITWETVSRLGAATTSSTGTAPVGVLRWRENRSLCIRMREIMIFRR